MATERVSAARGDDQRPGPPSPTRDDHLALAALAGWSLQRGCASRRERSGNERRGSVSNQSSAYALTVSRGKRRSVGVGVELRPGGERGAGGEPAVKCRSPFRALLVSPEGQPHAVDRATGGLSPRVVVEADSPRRLGMNRRSVGVARIRCPNLRCHARYAGYTEPRRGPPNSPSAHGADRGKLGSGQSLRTTSRSSPTEDTATGCRFGRLEIQSRRTERPEQVRPDGSAVVRAGAGALGQPSGVAAARTLRALPPRSGHWSPLMELPMFPSSADASFPLNSCSLVAPLGPSRCVCNPQVQLTGAGAARGAQDRGSGWALVVTGEPPLPVAIHSDLSMVSDAWTHA